MPQKPRRPCPTCGKLTRDTCHGAKTPPAVWAKISKTIIRNHVMIYGTTCPGVEELEHPPHNTTDLTVDHINGDPTDQNPNNLRVVCRTANIQLHNQSAPLYQPRPNPPYRGGPPATRISNESEERGR